MKRILINSSYGDELRVALVDGAKLYDFDTESPEKVLLKGSVFKATVSRIESSLDAAFVNFGSERHGFLPLKDLSSEFYKKDKKGKSICTLEEGQEIIVQVTKEERGTKGAALTTQIGLAGRFLVLIPNSSRSGGISRRISGDERDQIKSTLEKLNITTIESLNQPFNPDLHQAIGQEKKENTESNTVIKEVQKGFKLHDKIIRPAMVIVSE